MLRFSLSTLLMLTACSEPFSPESELHSESLDAAFQEAATRYNVPRDLLVALAWNASRLEHEVGVHDHGNAAHGVMGLVEEAEVGPSLEGAAMRLGVSPEVVMTDPRENILGAAAELSAYAAIWSAENDRPVEVLEDWAYVIGWYSGIDSADFQRSFGEEIFSVIGRGLSHRTPSGELIVIDSRPMDIPGYGLQPLSGVGSDYWGTASFVAASTSNYTNASRSTSDIDTVVVHTAQGSYSGTASWFTNSAAGASAHYVIRSSDGEVTQMVWEEDVAWHAGHSSTNWSAIGIEQEGYIESPETWYTDAMYQSLASLIADICDRYSIPRDRDHIIGHSEVPGCSYSGGGGSSCHTDPGSGFDWDKLMGLLGEEPTAEAEAETGSGGQTSGSTGSLVGYVREGDLYDSDAGISGATVTLSTGESVTTDSSGWFSFSSVPAGVVDITYAASGFLTDAASRDITSSAQSWASAALISDGTSAPVGYSYSPTGWQTSYGPDVTMAWDEPGSSYEVQIHYYDGSDWQYYYTYTTSSEDKTFWPVVDDTYYAWSVRAYDGGWQAWSALNYFYFSN